MAEREDVRLKKQQAAEAMQRARQTQLENARMQRELQAAARELARHQAEAAKARDAMLAAGERVRATAQSAGQSIAAQQGGVQQVKTAEQQRNTNTARPDAQVSAMSQAEVSQDEYWAGGRKAAEQRAAQQRAIMQAAERRALKKQAAEEAAVLLARQQAQEAKKHHTSPETKQLQNLLLEQIAEIMEEDKEENPVPGNSANMRSVQKPGEEMQTASGDETFGDLVFLDSNGEETKPEPPDVMKKALKDLDIEPEEYAQKETAIQKWGNLGQWFQTICWMHIPVIGFWYLVIVAIRKKTPKEKKVFAKAYILFRILVLILACTLLYIFYQMGLSFIEQILSYINAHL